MRRAAVVAMLVAVLVIPALVFAEEPPRPITVASFFKVMPGKGEAVIDLFKKYDKPVLDKLMAEGTITGWGIGRPWVHTTAAWNLLFWITAADLGAHEKVDQAFEAAEKGRSKEENKKIQETFFAAVAMDTHRDGVYRQVSGRAGRPSASPDGKGYLWLANYTAKPGKGDDVTSFFGAVVQPVMDKLIADGVVGGYGLVIPTVHVAGASTHIAWYWVDSLAGIDKVQAALRGAREKRSAEQNAELDARADAIFEPGTHSDDLLQVPMSGVK